MPIVTIRCLEGEERLDALYRLGTYAFSATPPLPNEEEWREIRRKRQGVTYFAAFEDETPVSGGGSTDMTENVRGVIYPASGVWGVATDPAARRKGLCRRMLQALLQANNEAGHVFSTLYPFRESFYERLGYVSFPLTQIAKLTPAVLTPLLKKDWGGTVERKSLADCHDEYRQFLYRLQPGIHGMGIFNHSDVAFAQRYPSWVALAYFDGQLEGLMPYTLQGEEITQFKFNATRFYTVSNRARYLLLSWIARHVDQAGRVEIRLQPHERPENWWSDLSVKIETPPYGPMGRVLNVSKIGGMQTGPGQFSARITDPFCPWNEGIWHFDGGSGHLEVRPGEQAECDLSIQGLTALVYGTHDPEDFELREWGNVPPKTQEVMRGVFPMVIPHLHENF